MDLIQKSKLIGFLNKVLKQVGQQTSEKEIVYICPFHRAINNVNRKKFGIDLDAAEYNCFACGESGKSYKSLLKKLKVSPALYKELYSIIGEHFKPNYTKSTKKNTDLQLPDEFKNMAIPSNSPGYKHALKYLKSRSITRDDILRYNIGYCEEGIYKNRIVIPSYDKNGNINFFSARDYLNSSYLKYLLPNWSKDIIGFELFINWNEPITLVEGAWDSISIRNNAIPLFGKIMSNCLKEAILENDVKRVNICLDNDALRSSIKISDYLTSYGVNVHLIEMDEKDPSVLGFDKIHTLIENSEEMDFSKMFSIKLNI